MTWRVVIADDHGVTRQGVRLMLQMIEDVEVVGEAGTGGDAVRACLENDANLVFMDINMPEMDGIEAIGEIKRVAPHTHIVVLTVHEDEDAVTRAIRAGASGFLAKSSSAEDIKMAIKNLSADGVYMSPSVTSRMLRSTFRRLHAPAANAPIAGISSITSREHEILVLLGEGMSARKIASRLSISERTVNTHIGNLYRRMGVNNRVDAIRAAMRVGLVEPPR